MSEPGRYAFAGLDRLIHERARLGIMTSLMAEPNGVLFPELRTLCELTDGNLSRHLQVLEEAKLITLEKSGAGRNKRTLVLITESGAQQFLEYLAELKSVLSDAASSANQTANVSRFGLSSG